MASANPLVTVVVPTYKRANLLPRALNSVFEQTYAPIELIVVNDNLPNSDEDIATKEILSRYVHSIPLKVVDTGGRKGGGAARNIACHEATGTYLAFLDDDDEFLPDKIETQLAFMRDNDLDLSWQDVCWYNSKGDLIEHRRLNHCKGYTHDEILRAHLRAPIAPTAIYMLTKELFDKTEGFGEVNVGQDWWLMLRCIEAGAKMGYMPEVHVRQYLHDGERLSLGKNKIEGTELRYQEMKKYYYVLDASDIRYVNFWHYAVLATAMKRSDEPLKAIGYAARAFFASPIDCLGKTIEFVTKGRK